MTRKKKEKIVADSVYAAEKRGQFKTVALRFRKNKLAMAGLIFLVILLILSLSLDLFMNYEEDALAQNVRNRNQGFSAEHPLGTDQFGRDMLARILYGARISISTTLVVIVIATTISVLIASVAGYFGGWVDNLIMRIMDIFYALPFNLMAVCIVASLGVGIVNLGLACVIGIMPGFVRVFRSYVLPLRNQEYIEAAKNCGTGHFRILTKHIIPNAIGPIIVQATLELSNTMIAISGLSFIGLGVAAPTPEWGLMLSEGTEYMLNYPHLVLVPGIAIVLVAMAMNLLGDGLRDALDPKLKN